MKENPTVCAIMLVNGREEMVKRAIKSFREQTYQKKRLLIWDTGEVRPAWDYGVTDIMCPDVATELLAGATIGALRNYANLYASHHYVKSEDRPEIFCHFDSDDLSHPRRIEEQVALLQASGKQCVGYRDMLFYDTTPGQFCGAWLYRHPTKPLGTSLMYWRSVWEARPFPDLPKAKGGTGEDVQWLEGVDHAAYSSFGADISLPPSVVPVEWDGYMPRMVASIHGGNTQHYDPPEYERQSNGTSWKRAAEWDEHCRAIMKL